MLREVQQINADVLGMFGDDPNPMVTTARVGSGTAFGRAREEGRGLTRELSLPGSRQWTV